ncbi:MAG: NTP transferase domain-containing protein [Thermoplasmata archaeon]|nr:NTP transferase domain-containing protein [Thermoplasmata archaeon]
MWENPTTDPDRRRPAWAAGVVLAAGASRRMGGYPKATVRIGAEAGVARIARLAVEAELDPVIVVVGPHADATRAHLRGVPVSVLDNPRWADGRTGTLQVALETLDPAQSVVVWPADHPFVESATVIDLGRRSAKDAMAVWVIPTYRGRSGHPVILRPPVLAMVRQMGRGEPLRNLIAHFGPQVGHLAVEDPGVVANVDSWAEYDRHLALWSSRQGERWTGA